MLPIPPSFPQCLFFPRLLKILIGDCPPSHKNSLGNLFLFKILNPERENLQRNHLRTFTSFFTVPKIPIYPICLPFPLSPSLMSSQCLWLPHLIVYCTLRGDGATGPHPGPSHLRPGQCYQGWCRRGEWSGELSKAPECCQDPGWCHSQDGRGCQGIKPSVQTPILGPLGKLERSRWSVSFDGRPRKVRKFKRTNKGTLRKQMSSWLVDYGPGF